MTFASELSPLVELLANQMWTHLILGITIQPSLLKLYLIADLTMILS